MEESKYCLKVDLRKFFESIDTEELRSLRDKVVEEVKNREREERKNMPPARPEYRYWKGKVIRRRGNALSRYGYLLEPVEVNDVPQDVINQFKETYFTMLGGKFKKATCPKIGDEVVLKYRLLKNSPIGTSFRRSRIIAVVPPMLAE